MNEKIILALVALFVASLPLLEISMSGSIIITSIPVSQLIQHEISSLDTAKNIIGESNVINETVTSLNSGLSNLSLINAQIVPIALFTAWTFGVIVFYGRYLKDRKFTSRLGDATSIAIGICFGIMILFYTAADLTSLSIEQVTTETLTLISNDKTHVNQLKILENFILEKIAEYRIDVESSIFFGVMTLLVVISFIWNKIKSDSIFPHILFYIVIGTIIIWTIEYFLHIFPQNTSFSPCLKVNC